MKSRRFPESAVYVLEKMAHGFGRMGRDHGGGFYDYPDGEAPHLWSGLKAFERRSRNIASDDIRDRLLYAQALETARCIHEGVITDPSDADAGSVLGCGFPASTGGCVQFIDRIGTAAFVQRARELAAAYGERFEPPPLLVGREKPGAGT